MIRCQSRCPPGPAIGSRRPSVGSDTGQCHRAGDRAARSTHLTGGPRKRSGKRCHHAHPSCLLSGVVLNATVGSTVCSTGYGFEYASLLHDHRRVQNQCRLTMQKLLQKPSPSPTMHRDNVRWVQHQAQQASLSTVRSLQPYATLPRDQHEPSSLSLSPAKKSDRA